MGQTERRFATIKRESTFLELKRISQNSNLKDVCVDITYCIVLVLVNVQCVCFVCDTIYMYRIITISQCFH